VHSTKLAGPVSSDWACTYNAKLLLRIDVPPHDSYSALKVA
jgi:hypothetical protein